MLKIAICDDSPTDREELYNKLVYCQVQQDKDFEIAQFSSGEELYENFLTNEFHIVLMDIFMDKMDGIETAHKLMKRNSDVIFIFISSYDSRVKELFSLQTFSFLDKPVVQEQLNQVLERFFLQIEQENSKFFSYSDKGSTFYVPHKDIYYFEIISHYLHIVTKNGTITYKGNITDLWHELKHMDCYTQPNRSFIVNVKYCSISSKSVKISAINKIISITSNYRDELERKFALFYK